MVSRFPDSPDSPSKPAPFNSLRPRVCSDYFSLEDRVVFWCYGAYKKYPRSHGADHGSNGCGPEPHGEPGNSSYFESSFTAETCSDPPEHNYVLPNTKTDVQHAREHVWWTCFKGPLPALSQSCVCARCALARCLVLLATLESSWLLSAHQPATGRQSHRPASRERPDSTDRVLLAPL